MRRARFDRRSATLNTFLPGSVDSTFVMCSCIGIGFFSTSTSGVVPEKLNQGSELSQFC